MEADKIANTKIYDIVKEPTRKSRKNMLIFSVLVVLYLKTALRPNEINSLGIKFTSETQNTIILILFAFVIYYLIAFLIYTITDFINWKLKYYSMIRDSVSKKKNESTDLTDKLLIETHNEMIQEFKIYKIAFYFTNPLSVIIIIWEFIIPIIFVIITIIMFAVT